MDFKEDFKLLKSKEIDTDTFLRISKNLMSGRIFVEFSCKNPNLMIQKNFEDSLYGKKQADTFSKTFKNADQIRKYFKIKTEK
jgi:hypothetical protein